MTTFNKDMVYTAGLLGAAVGALLGLTVGAFASNGNRPEAPRFNESKIEIIEETYWTSGTSVWTTVYHASYDDGKYLFEASDLTRSAAIAAVRNMVLA